MYLNIIPGLVPFVDFKASSGGPVPLVPFFSPIRELDDNVKASGGLPYSKF